jgi:hypothetical protein
MTLLVDGGAEYFGDDKGNLVPAEAAADLMAHGFIPLQFEGAQLRRISKCAKPMPPMA